MSETNLSETTSKNLKSNISKLYVYKALTGSFFAIPIMVLFWQDNGLSFTQIMVLQAYFSILIVLLEIPTGYFADLYGRKASIIVSSFGLGFSILIYSFGKSYLTFFLAETFFAIQASFYSGSVSALLYDTLVDLKEEHKYKEIWGKSMSYGLFALAISGIIGAFAAKYNLRYAIWLSVPFFLATIPFAFSFTEPTRHKIVVKKGYMKELLTIVKDIFLKEKNLRWLIIYSALILGLNKAGVWTYQPYMKLIGIDVVYFGFIFAGFAIFTAMISKYAYIIEKKLGKRWSLIMLVILTSAGYFFMGTLTIKLSLAFIFIGQFVRGFRSVVVTDYINQLTDSSIRATVLSAESLIGKLIYALIIPLIGWVADVFSLEQALLMVGIVTLLVGGILLGIMKNDHVI